MEIKDLSNWLDRSLGNEIGKSYKIITCYMLIQAAFLLLKRYMLPLLGPASTSSVPFPPHSLTLPFSLPKQPSPDWPPSPPFHWNWSDEGHQSLPCCKDLAVFSQYLSSYLSRSDHFLKRFFPKFTLSSSTLLVFRKPIWWLFNLLC